MNDTKFAQFNSIFPSALYRRVFSQYVPADGEEYDKEKYSKAKRPTDANIYKYNDLKDLSTRVGWIISPGYIVVDIDNRTNADCTRRLLVDKGVKHCYLKTKNGAHFIFKAPSRKITNSARRTCALSILVDYRTEGAGYIILPHNDSGRDWTDLQEKVDELPVYLFPLQCEAINMTGLGSGDGRNDLLFRWFALMRKTTSISREVKVETIRLINEYFFTEPIRDEELDKTVLREENVANSAMPKQSAAEREYNVAMQILEDKHLVSDLIYLYEYTGVYYKRVKDMEMEREISDKYDATLRENNRNEIIAHLKLKAPYVANNVEDNWQLIAFKNVVVNILTGEMFTPSPELYVSTYIGRNYVTNSPVSEKIESFLGRCANNDNQKRTILLEMMGDCFLKRSLFQKMYLIYGEGCTGKSTLLRLVTNLITDSNTTYLSLKDLENAFYPAELVGKLANIGDDIPFGKITDSSQIKKLASGEKMMIQRKYGQPMWFANFATLIFTTNKLPQTADRTSGFMRRLVLVDMNTRIKEPNAFFLDRLDDNDYEYLLMIAVNAIRAAIARGELTRSFTVDNNIQAYQRMQSALSEYMDEENVTKENIIGRTVAEVYAEYCFYCNTNGMRPIGKHNFVADIMSLLYITTAKIVDVTDPEKKSLLRFAYVAN